MEGAMIITECSGNHAALATAGGVAGPNIKATEIAR